MTKARAKAAPEMEESLNWAELTLLRQGLYRFFGAVFMAPSQDGIQALGAGALVLDSLGIDRFAYSGPWQKLRSAMGALQSATDLEAIYISLFVVGGGRTPCPPVESHYVGDPSKGEAGVFDAELKRYYQDLGLALSSTHRHTHDHLSVELEVMSALCAREHTAWEDGVFGAAAGEQRCELDFLNKHLGTWLGLFACRVAEAQSAGFYSDAAAACWAFVHHDHEFLRLIVQMRDDPESDD